jgi:hypothetical protein
MAIDGVRQGDSIGFLELEGTAGSSSRKQIAERVASEFGMRPATFYRSGSS